MTPGIIGIQSVGDQVMPGVYPLHSRFDRVINFHSGQRLVSLVTEDVGEGPGNVVMDELPSCGLSSLVIGQDEMTLGNEVVSLAGVRRFSSVWEGTPGKRDLGLQMGYFKNALLAHAPEKSLAFLVDPAREAFFKSAFEREIVRRFREAVRSVRSGDVRSAAMMVRGVGWGLTPSGDDFIAGLCWAEHFGEKEKSLEWVVGSSLVSDAFLQRAKRGFACQRWKRVFSALIAGGPGEIESAVKGLLEMGATSGADAAVGFFIGMEGVEHGCQNACQKG